MHDSAEDTPTAQPGDEVRIMLADTKDILSWSYGEVSTAELFDPAQQSFHPAGLFSEAIFGRLRKYDPALKKYQDADPTARFVQSKWNMDVMNPERRTRFAHISLPVPVIHPWFWGHDDAPLELLLDLPHRRIRGIVSGQIAVDLLFPGPYLTYRTECLEDGDQARFAWEPQLQERTGAVAISEMLARLNYSAQYQILQERQAASGSALSARESQRLKQRISLLRAVVEHRLSPTALVLDALPVLPVGLRGLRLGRDGKVRTDWLTAAYRRIIRIAARYQAVVDEFVGRCRPTRVEMHQARRLRIALTCEIEWLFAELLRRGSPRRRDRFWSRPPKLSWRNSQPAEWRPVVPDPDLRLFQCQIPRADWKNQVSDPDPTLEDLSDILPSSLPPALLECAPIESPRELAVLQPVLGSDRAIHVHPQLLCSLSHDHVTPLGRFVALESDSTQQDGDRLAFPIRRPQSLPVSFDALPTELLVGCTWATRLPADFDLVCDQWLPYGLDSRQDHHVFASLQAVAQAWEAGRLRLSQVIAVQLPRQKVPADSERELRGNIPAGRYCTTTGRAVINVLLPETMPFWDHTFTKPVLQRLIQQVKVRHGAACAAGLLESLTEFARQALTRTGMSLSCDDLRPPSQLIEVMNELDKKLLRAQKMLHRGVISSMESQQLHFNAYSEAVTRADSAIGNHVSTHGDPGELLRVVAIGTRALSRQSLQSLCGVPGSVQLCGSTRPHFVRSNYHGGMTMLDYWSVAAVETQLRLEQVPPPHAATVRRRLTNLLRDVVVAAEDCETQAGFTIRVEAAEDGIQARKEFIHSITGRVSLETIDDPARKMPVISAGAVITRPQAEQAANAGIRCLRVRHTLHCEARHGVCRRCYGADAESGELVELGAPVGIRAAFDVGSLLDRLPRAASRLKSDSIREDTEVLARVSGVVSLKRIKLMINRNGERISLSNSGWIELVSAQGDLIDRYRVPHGAHILVAAGDRVQPNTLLANWSASTEPVYALRDGRVRITGARFRSCTLISIEDPSGIAVDGCLVPSSADYAVADGDVIKAGTLLAELVRRPQAKSPSRHPDLREFRRILSLRSPRRPAVLAESDGTVELEYDGASSCCAVRLHRRHAVPNRQVIRLTRSRTLVVRTGDHVEPGDPLTLGEVDLTQLVRLKGPATCYALLHEQLERCVPYSFRPAGFDARHLELLLTRLFRWAEVANAGDSGFHSGQVLPKVRILARNKQLRTMVMVHAMPGDARAVPQDPITLKEFEFLRARLLTEDPELPPIEADTPWPAGWTPLLRGWDQAAAGSGSPLSSGGFHPTKSALVQAALAGESQELSGVKDAMLLGRRIELGDGIRRSEPS